jgi:hypothetical protein
VNWGTSYQRILLSSGKPANQADHVKHALIDALDHHRHDQFYFNALAFNFTLTASTANYGEATTGFPKELISVVGEHLYLDRAGVASDRYPLARVSQEELELCQSAGGAYTAQPEIWAFFNREIHFYPTPDSSTDVVRGRAYVDQWVPILRFETPNWKYYKPLTTSFIAPNELTDTYPVTPLDLNPWFTESGAAAMIRHYAEYLVWSQHWQANDGQDQKALMAYTQARHALESRSSSMLAPLQVEPYPIGPFA